MGPQTCRGLGHSKAGPVMSSSLERGAQFMGWYSEYRLGPSSTNRPPASSMSPGAPRATAMMPRTSGDKVSTGGVPMPRSMDLHTASREGGRRLRKAGGEAPPPHVTSVQAPPPLPRLCAPSPRPSAQPRLSPAEVVSVPIPRACGSPKGQIEGTEVVLGPKEGSDNGRLGEKVRQGGVKRGSVAGQGGFPAPLLLGESHWSPLHEARREGTPQQLVQLGRKADEAR